MENGGYGGGERLRGLQRGKSGCCSEGGWVSWGQLEKTRRGVVGGGEND